MTAWSLATSSAIQLSYWTNIGGGTTGKVFVIVLDKGYLRRCDICLYIAQFGNVKRYA